MNRDVLIVGGGIGGLAAALVCSRLDLPVKLFERSAVFSELGAGVQLGPNVVRLLDLWGLMPALREVGCLPAALQVRNARSGAQLGRLELGRRAIEQYGAPYLTIHRGELHSLLLAAVDRQPTVELHLNARIEAITTRSDGLTLQHAGGELTPGRLVLGADGVWSRLRRQLLDDGDPRPTGHLAYRALIAQSDLPEALRSSGITLWLGPRLHAVVYPVRGGDWLNVVVIVEGSTQGDLQSWDQAGAAEDLRQALTGTATALQDLVAAVPAWRLWHLMARRPVQGPQQIAQGRVALLGDAAHPMLPYLSQGAGMAIEDAQALGHALAAEGLTPQALSRYAALRWQRNARVQARALRNGWIFHLDGPLAWGRNAAMRLLGQRVLDMPWLYRGP